MNQLLEQVETEQVEILMDADRHWYIQIPNAQTISEFPRTRITPQLRRRMRRTKQASEAVLSCGIS